MAQPTLGSDGAVNGKVNGGTMNAAAADRSSVSGSASRKRRATSPKGLAIPRHFTRAGANPLDEVAWERRTSVITNPDGSVVFKMEGAEVPAGWSQLATDIVVSKYFRKAGLHGDKERRRDERAPGRPPHRAHHPRGGRAVRRLLRDARRTPTRSRPSCPICSSTSTARSTRPVWFNCGLFHATASRARAATGPGTPRRDDQIVETTNAYERPQCSACFIQSVERRPDVASTSS